MSVSTSGAVRGLADAEGAEAIADGDERGVADRGKLDEEGAVGIARQALGGDLEGEARLARAAGPGQRHQPGAIEQLADGRDLALATDEARQLDGQVVGPRVERAQGRELGRQARRPRAG